ncbi:hypothetical protein [Flavitalea sp. BT771]|uniref:hypothetical protein n=1 Tax=Flavitalea sp. BT771 TaxID=3063329 RepID=UPI0026E1DA45|nr:hypothetical protein [Flavitalea sp. BT771]MDV6221878.1 hypothetical protein [Flavitalea sp. BT771]
MIYHVLNGDSLAYSFPAAAITGEVIVDREGLIDGDLGGDDLPGFWHSRAAFMGLPEDEYRRMVVAEFEKILAAPPGAEFNLWFEFDLFCQVNMWFVLSLLAGMAVEKKVYVVYTSWLSREDKHFWNGFGPATTAQIKEAFDNRILLTAADLQYGRDLWAAYKNGDLAALRRLSQSRTGAFPYVQEVIEAHIERFPANGQRGRPERVLAAIMQNGQTDFKIVFREFWNCESIYGFGDLQLMPLYKKVLMEGV